VLRADVDLEVEQARVAGYPLSGLQLPAGLVVTPETGSGTVTIRRAHARLAGGRVEGDATLHIGRDRSFQGQAQIADLDLQTITRLGSDASRPPSGRIGGRVSVSGTDPARPESYRGRVDLSLTDASVFSIPVFREIDRFLGAARGGLFEQGELIGSISNRRFVVEDLGLEGRLVQLHATGTVGFDERLNLEVLVNTSQIIPETGQALVERIPGLRDVLGRNQQAVARVGSYLSNRLLKLRVAGTLRNPVVVTDPGIIVGEVAVSFFADVLKLPLGLLR
jgi:translocation and assembly module TamB